MPTEESAQRNAGETWKVSCPRCRYDTRELASERCPECGITRGEADELLAAKELTQQSGNLAVFSTLSAIFAVAIAFGDLHSAHQWGFDSGTHRIRVGIRLVTCGGLIAIGVINGVRHARGRKLLSFWWVALLMIALLSHCAP